MFDTIDTEEKSYSLGFIYADGHVRKRTLILALKESDHKQLEKFKLFMRSESPVKLVTKKIKSKEYPAVHIEFTDEHLAARLTELGIVKGRPAFQATISAIPNALTHHFIRGFFDGDGCADKRGTILFCGRKDFL